MSRDGYDRDRDDVENNMRGRVWENGADRFFRDHENGYSRPSRARELRDRSGTRRRYDKQRGNPATGPVQAIEEKSGEIRGVKDEDQLERDYELLRDGKVDHLLLRSVAGERISPSAQKLIDNLKRDFPNSFTHQIVSRADAREIWALGRQLERGQQLELPGVAEKAREQVREQRGRGRDQVFVKALEARKELAGQRDHHSAQVREQVQQIAERAEAGEPVDNEALAKKHEQLIKKLDKIREAERKNERTLLRSLGIQLSEEQLRTVEQVKEEQRELRRRDVVTDLELIGREVERGRWREISNEHNARVRELGVEHVRAVEQRFVRAGPERDLAIEQARRRAERLLFTPDKTAGLDLDRFHAVRDGRDTGYDPQNRTHTYRRPDMPAVQVEHDARERRLARIARDVEHGLSVDQILTRDVMEVSAAEPGIEAARADAIHRATTSQRRHRQPERDRERGIDRGPERSC